MSEEEKKAIEIKLKRIRNVMNNFEDLLCEDMQNEVDEIKEYIEKLQKENEELKTAHRKNGRVLFTIEAINERYIHKDKIREIKNKYKVDSTETFIRNQENHIMLIEELEELLKEN